MTKEKPKLSAPSSDNSSLVPSEKHGQEKLSLPAEVIEALDSSSANVDVNVLLIQLIQKAPDPNQFLEQSDRFIEMVEKFEAQRLENFKARANAVIDIKTRDPDEKDKRANNAARRFLKRMIGWLAPLAVGAAAIGFWQGAPALVMIMLLAVVGLCITFAGVLATGESVTTADVVQIMREFGRGALAKASQNEDPPPQKRRRRKS